MNLKSLPSFPDPSLVSYSTETTPVCMSVPFRTSDWDVPENDVSLLTCPLLPLLAFPFWNRVLVH